MAARTLPPASKPPLGELALAGRFGDAVGRHYSCFEEAVGESCIFIEHSRNHVSRLPGGLRKGTARRER
jgi:hypothetical protein